MSCASAPQVGPVGEGFALRPVITRVDSTQPPGYVDIQLDRPGEVALLLVAPGYSATLLYPPDSTTANRFDAGAHQISFRIPDVLVNADSARNAARMGRGMDTSRARIRSRNRGRVATPMPLPDAVPTILLLVTSPQELSYGRIIEKTAGVSIPTLRDEALNAVAKAIKSTLPNEPREWAGYFVVLELRDEGS
jgi:hypothetical protein